VQQHNSVKKHQIDLWLTEKMATHQHKANMNDAYHQQEAKLVHLKAEEEHSTINLKIKLIWLQLEAEKLRVKKLELGHMSSEVIDVSHSHTSAPPPVKNLFL
jgi:hypothetical protein